MQTVARLDRAGASDIVERIAVLAAVEIHGAAVRDVLVARDAPAEAKHGVREQVAAGQERLLTQTPPHAHRGERAPAVIRPQPGGAIAPQGEAGEVFLGKVVIGLAEERQQRPDAGRAVHGLRRRHAQDVRDVARIRGGVDQVVDAAGDVRVVVPVRFLSQQHGNIVPARRTGVTQGIAPRPLGEIGVSLREGIAGGRLGVLGPGRRKTLERLLTHVEPEQGLERDLTREVETAVHVPEDPRETVAVVLAVVRVPEWIALIAQPHRFARGEMRPADVVNRDDRLHQDVLPEDAVLGITGGVVREPAVVLFAR